MTHRSAAAGWSRLGSYVRQELPCAGRTGARAEPSLSKPAAGPPPYGCAPTLTQPLCPPLLQRQQASEGLAATGGSQYDPVWALLKEAALLEVRWLLAGGCCVHGEAAFGQMTLRARLRLSSLPAVPCILAPAWNSGGAPHCSLPWHH